MSVRDRINDIAKAFEYYANIGSKVDYAHTVAAIQAALDECDKEPWQSMDSAPKGPPILACVDGQTRIVQWGKTSHVPLYGWCLADQGVEDYDICEPTHWTPIPVLPKEA